MFRLLSFLVLLALLQPLRADDVDDLMRADSQVKTRAAWDKVVAQGPVIVPRLLEAMDTTDVARANWLRTAFDRVVADGKGVDVEALVKFAGDRKRQGRARRLALETAETLKPGSRDKLLHDAVDDPEFRFESIDLALARIDLKDITRELALKEFRRLFDASRDLEQARRIAGHLKPLGVAASVADHLGFLREWYVVGPFDATGFGGFKRAYPPEKQVDLKATYEGKDGKSLAWKRLSVKETTTGKHAALVDLRGPLGDAEDAVAFAWTSVRVKDAGEVEFRGAADDNFTIWVNGERVFGFEEYRNGVRLDRHRFKVRLKAGLNTVLVKVCQAPMDMTHREPNWEFLLRICDDTGKGIALKHEE